MMIAERLGFDSVVLEIDALSLVCAIMLKNEGAAPMLLFCNDIERISRVFNLFPCAHVGRVGQKAFHFIARWDFNVDID